MRLQTYLPIYIPLEYFLLENSPTGRSLVRMLKKVGFMMAGALSSIEVWKAALRADDVQPRSLTDGRLVLYPDRSEARYMRLEIMDPALKSLRIPELKMFSCKEQKK